MFTSDDIHVAMVKRRKERFNCRIDMSALAAVLFTLLYGMTIIAGYSHPRRTDLLPHSTHSDTYPGANKDDAMIVGLQRDGTIYFRSSRVTSAGLSIAIQDAVSRGAEPAVYIYADGRAKYGAILEAVDAANAAGVRNVALMTQPSKQEPFSHPLF